MQLNVEKLGPCQARVSFSVPASDFQARFKSGLLEAAGKANLKGFRPGKVPVQVIEKQFGEQIKLETKKHFLEQAFQQAVEKEQLRPASWPRVVPEQIAFGTGGEFAHSFEVLLRPAVELKEYAGLEIAAQPIEVSEADIDAALADLRRQQSRLEAAGADGLPVDGMGVARVELLHDGQSVLARDGWRLSPKDAPPGVDGKAFEQALTGCKEGESRELPITFPENFEVPALVGKTGVCRIQLAQAYKVVPPSEAELFKVTGTESLEALRSKAREHIVIAKQAQENARQENELFERLLDLHPLELPEPLIDEQAQARLNALQQQLVQSGVSEANAAQRAESEREVARTTSRRALQALYLVEAIAQKEQVQLTQQDFARELQNIATRNRATFEQVRDFYNQNQNLREQMAMELLERRVRALLREKAKIAGAA